MRCMHLKLHLECNFERAWLNPVILLIYAITQNKTHREYNARSTQPNQKGDVKRNCIVNGGAYNKSHTIQSIRIWLVGWTQQEQQQTVHTISQIAFLFGLLFDFFFCSRTRLLFDPHFPIVIWILDVFPRFLCRATNNVFNIHFKYGSDEWSLTNPT